MNLELTFTSMVYINFQLYERQTQMIYGVGSPSVVSSSINNYLHFNQLIQNYWGIFFYFMKFGDYHLCFQICTNKELCPIYLLKLTTEDGTQDNNSVLNTVTPKYTYWYVSSYFV